MTTIKSCPLCGAKVERRVGTMLEGMLCCTGDWCPLKDPLCDLWEDYTQENFARLTKVVLDVTKK